MFFWCLFNVQKFKMVRMLIHTCKCSENVNSCYFIKKDPKLSRLHDFYEIQPGGKNFKFLNFLNNHPTNYLMESLF